MMRGSDIRMLAPQGSLLSVPTSISVPTTLDRLADRLHEEFAAPVGLFDLNEGRWEVRLGARPEAFPGPGDCSFLSTDRCGRVELWRHRDGVSPIWLIVPISGPLDSELAAWIGFSSGPGPLKPWGPPCPERALMAWGQDVADRLRTRSAAQTAPTNPVSTPALIEHLLRRLRVSDPPERFQRLATSATREALGVEAVAWVPAPGREPVILAGQVAGLEPEAVRDLLPESWNDLAWVVNRSTAPNHETSRRIAAVAADTGPPTGWLVALNPGNGRPFTSADVDVLQPVASIVGTQRGNARLYVELRELLFGVVRALTSAIDAKDPYTSGHSERVARIAVRLGEALGMSSHQRGDLYLMGLLHDIGKIGVEDVVLKKPGRLTPEEYNQIQAHVRIGVRILADLKKLHHLLPGVAYHHEKLDGSGYPNGLVGDAIPLAARILAVADAFDAMSSTRPYRRRLTPAQIDEIFRGGSGSQWDARVVAALFSCRAEIESIRQKGLGESLQQAISEAVDR